MMNRGVYSRVAADTPVGARVIQVIEVTASRGAGIPGDILRHVTQYWSLDGELLAERDDFPTAVDNDVFLEFSPKPDAP